MANGKSTNHLTRAERIELARVANILISGYSGELMRMVRDQHVDSNADTHRAALGMLATINSLSDDIFGLVFGDENDEVTIQEADAIRRKLGLEQHAAGGMEASGPDHG
jgi:hypothetical protein